MIWFLAGALVLGLLVGTFYWLAWAPPRQVGKALAAIVVLLLAGFAIALLATGKLFAALPTLVAALTAFWRVGTLARAIARRAAWLGRSRAGSGGATASTVRTAMLEMELDHASGMISGRILSGRHAGKSLDTLDLDELLALREELATADADGLRLLEAWLDRHHGTGWRGAADDATGPAPASDGPMSEAEARAILGLDEHADRAAIHAAHRALMKKLHPDTGGSAWFAAKLNAAKDVLLAREGG